MVKDAVQAKSHIPLLSLYNSMSTRLSVLFSSSSFHVFPSGSSQSYGELGLL